MTPLRMAVIGAGVMGGKHVGYVQADPYCALAALVDPDPAAAAVAREHGARHYRDVGELLAAERIDGATIGAASLVAIAGGLARGSAIYATPATGRWRASRDCCPPAGRQGSSWPWSCCTP